MTDIERRAILCPNCRKLIDADESECPYCGSPRPGSRWKTLLANLLSPKQDSMVTYIIYANVFMYVVSILFSSANIGLSGNPLLFLAPSSQAMLLLGATGTVPVDQFGRWWTLVSANYLHGGLLHIFFNMMALRQLGPLVAREYGVYRMVAIYTLSGIGGYWLSYEAGVKFTIGASAAVTGLIGAVLYYGKSRGGNYGQALFKEVSGWVVALFLFGFIVPGINNWGHGGGIAAGIVTGYLLGYREKRRDSFLHILLSAGCILLTLAVLLWAIVTAFYYTLAG